LLLFLGGMGEKKDTSMEFISVVAAAGQGPAELDEGARFAARFGRRCIIQRWLFKCGGLLTANKHCEGVEQVAIMDGCPSGVPLEV
jgi:hypothetical protein